MEYDDTASAGVMSDDCSVAGGSNFYEVQANGAAVLISRTLVREALSINTHIGAENSGMTEWRGDCVRQPRHLRGYQAQEKRPAATGAR